MALDGLKEAPGVLPASEFLPDFSVSQGQNSG